MTLFHTPWIIPIVATISLLWADRIYSEDNFSVFAIVAADAETTQARNFVEGKLRTLEDVVVVDDVQDADFVLSVSIYKFPENQGYAAGVYEAETIAGFEPSNWNDETALWVAYLRKEGFTKSVGRRIYVDLILQAVCERSVAEFDKAVLEPKRKAANR